MIEIGSNTSVEDYDPYLAAKGYVLLGEKDQALAWLNKAAEAHSGILFINIRTPTGTPSARTLALPTCCAGWVCRSDAFFTPSWKDADPDIPILKEAKAEYAKLK